jgi:hypothetical protein
MANNNAKRNATPATPAALPAIAGAGSAIASGLAAAIAAQQAGIAPSGIAATGPAYKYAKMQGGVCAKFAATVYTTGNAKPFVGKGGGLTVAAVMWQAAQAAIAANGGKATGLQICQTAASAPYIGMLQSLPKAQKYIAKGVPQAGWLQGYVQGHLAKAQGGIAPGLVLAS